MDFLFELIDGGGGEMRGFALGALKEFSCWTIKAKSCCLAFVLVLG